MRKLICLFLFFVTLSLSFTAYAILSMELTRGVSGATPIAVVPFATEGQVPQDVSNIIGADLQNSGRFKVYGRGQVTQFPTDPGKVSNDYFRKLGTDNIVIGKVNALGNDRYDITFQLLSLGGAAPALVDINQKFTVAGNELRGVAHHISDLVYEKITGVRGIFSTKLAYVVVHHENAKAAKYMLEVADADGFNPRPLLTSPEPIMSPSWSPTGRAIAYVSFENRRASIYTEDITTGTRHLLSSFPGINGAPAWSPDGRKMALVLSKTGTPNIYIMDVSNGSLKQVTKDYYINTEPAWSPDGKSLVFTSNRSGGPQIYQVNLATNNSSRLTYDGDYNARASYSRDGKSIAMIHRVAGIFNIAMLDLDTGTLKVLSSQSGDSSSPSIAPNGSMILYDTYTGNRNVLGMVSSDGRVQLRLPARDGEAQDPAWSPFMS